MLQAYISLCLGLSDTTLYFVTIGWSNRLLRKVIDKEQLI